MPLLMEPGQTIDICLEMDKDKPKESRPTFVALAQSARGQRKISKTIDSWSSSESIDELFDATLALLGELLTGWKNMPARWGEYASDKIEGLLTYSEIRELIRAVRDNQQLTEEEKKSSD